MGAWVSAIHIGIMLENIEFSRSWANLGLACVVCPAIEMLRNVAIASVIFL